MPADPTRAAPAFWGIAVLIGVAAGYAAIGFRLAIYAIQEALYGADDYAIHSAAADLNPLLVIVIPILGGLAVGWVLTRFGAQGRALGVADAIEAAALRDGRVNARQGAASAVAALITLSAGGSSGREGPVVHLAAVIAAQVSRWLDLHGVTARNLLGCAAAAAVSASFNAPLAGALFALEVVLRHYAVHAFGPIVLASAAGAVVSRLHMGDVTEFLLPAPAPSFFYELPAFALLGLLSGFVAIAMMRSIFYAEGLGDRLRARFGVPPILRPACAGAALGVTAVAFPHVIGVGYETTSRALTGSLDFWTCVAFAVVKTAAVAATFAGRMGGGVFSPSLMLGALTGGAFGAVALAVAPVQAGSAGLYAVAGMGAVASAVLGAPISTTLIVFEMTGDYQAALAVMVASSLAAVVGHRFVQKSFFLTQLARAGVLLAGGPRDWLPRTLPVDRLMRPLPAEEADAAAAMIARGHYLRRSETLAAALPLFDRLNCDWLPVATRDPPQPAGRLTQVDALKALNRALEEAHREEHS
jgi:CIC family chloride channel protein